MTGQPAWQQLGGNAAEVYQSQQVPALMAPLAPKLIAVAALRPGEHVLDVACGTGVVARLAAEQVGQAGRVVGLDFSAAMLAVAQSLPPAAGAVVEWCEASALAIPLPDASFDVALCQHGVQQFSDRVAGLTQIRRVLKPGGRFVATVWGRLENCPGLAALVDALERHVGSAAADNRRAPFSLSDAGELEHLAHEAGFSDVSVQTIVSSGHYPSPEGLVSAQLAGSPLSQVGGMTDEALAAVIHDVGSALQPYITADSMVFPMEVNLIAARA